jgi:uncharacterized protein with ATP-grasp and redox domains
MKTFPECYQCLLKQALTAAKSTDASEEDQILALKGVLQVLQQTYDRESPSYIAGETNQVLREILGVTDFYLEEKRVSHQRALAHLDDLRELLSQGEDSLEQGLKIAAAGNIMDVIHVGDYDLWQEVITTISQPLMGGGLAAFRERVSQAPFLLYLADNVGETLFDRVLIETLEIPVVYAVKSGPILNDATMVDALAAGIDQVAEVVETGSCSPGTILKQASPTFQKLFAESSLVLSKGQANYETLDQSGEKVFFLLRLKCPVLCSRLDAPLGSLVLKQGISAS